MGSEMCIRDSIISSHGKRLSFGAVAEAAASRPLPADVPLKAAADYVVIGKPQKRLDTPAKVDGSAVYGIDVQLDGMLYGALAQSPVLLGTVKSYQDDKAKTMPGVRAVVPTSSGIVVAVSYTHLRAHETVLDLVCRLLLEKKKNKSRQACIPVTTLTHG